MTLVLYDTGPLSQCRRLTQALSMLTWHHNIKVKIVGHWVTLAKISLKWCQVLPSVIKGHVSNIPSEPVWQTQLLPWVSQFDLWSDLNNAAKSYLRYTSEVSNLIFIARPCQVNFVAVRTKREIYIILALTSESVNVTNLAYLRAQVGIQGERYFEMQMF